MNERTKRLRERNEKIREDFAKMTGKVSTKGTKIYSQDYIMETLGQKYCLSHRTVDDIVFGRTKYEKRKVKQ